MKRPDDMNDVLEQLATLAPAEADTPRPASVALAQLRAQTTGTNRSTMTTTGRFIPMFRRKYAAFALVLFVFLAAFALPPVRAAASDFLGLFRVQKFAAISISPRQVELLHDLADQGLYPGEFESIEKPGPRKPVASLAEAQAATGLEIRTASALAKPDQIYVAEGGSGRLTVDVEKARAILEAAEVDPEMLPDNLHGATIDVTIYPGVEQVWHDGLRLVQTESPLINYPDDVNTAVLGQALLQVLGMTPGEARRLARDIDWSSTLVLPIPENLATFSELKVNGTSALALTSIDGSENSLMWQSDGIIYVLAGDRGVAELGEIAESIR